MTANGVWPSTSLSYASRAGALKETLVLSSGEAPKSFRFQFSSQGLEPRVAKDRSVLLVGASGRPAMRISRPWMQDALGRRSYAIAVDVSPVAGGFEYALALDNAWLTTASYPVTVDPTVTIATPIAAGTGVKGDPDNAQPELPGMCSQLGIEDLIVGTTFDAMGVEDPNYTFETALVFADTAAAAGIPLNHQATQASLTLITDSGGGGITAFDLPKPSGTPISWNSIQEAFNAAASHASASFYVDPAYAACDSLDPNSATFAYDITPVAKRWTAAPNSPLGIRLAASATDAPFHFQVVGVTIDSAPPPTFVSSDAYSITLSVPNNPLATDTRIEVYTDANHQTKWYAYDGLLDPVHVAGPLNTDWVCRIPSLGAATTYYLRVVYAIGNNGYFVDADPITTEAVNAESAIEANPTVPASLGMNGGFNPEEENSLQGLPLGGFATYLENLQFGKEDGLNPLGAVVQKTASVVRTQVTWETTETGIGVYGFGTDSEAPGDDLSRLRHFVARVAGSGLTPLIVLAYGNSRYDFTRRTALPCDDCPFSPTGTLSAQVPYSDDQMLAYGRWAAEVVKSYRYSFPNTKFIWELWNEPGAVSREYTVFFATATAFIRSVDPNATIIGPTYADARWYGLLEGTMKTCPIESGAQVRVYPGILSLCDAVDMHTYIHKTPGNPLVVPEASVEYLAKARSLMDKYAPSRKLPISTSEWGYSVSEFDAEEQARYLVRQRLFELSRGVTLGTWFSFRDSSDGSLGLFDLGVQDHGKYASPRFTYNNYIHDQTAKPDEPKLVAARSSYTAAANLMSEFDGFRFQYLMPHNENEEKMLFYRASDQTWKVAAWTTDGTEHFPLGTGANPEPAVPTGWNVLRVVDHLGNLTTYDRLDPSPRYMTVEPQVRAVWSWLKPLDSISTGSSTMCLENVSGAPHGYSVEVTIDGADVQVSPSSLILPIPETGSNSASFTVNVIHAPADGQAVAHVIVREDNNQNASYAEIPVLVRPSITATASDLVFLGPNQVWQHEGWYTCVQLESSGVSLLGREFAYELVGTVGNGGSITAQLDITNEPDTPWRKSVWVRTNVPATSIPVAPYTYSVTVRDPASGQVVCEAQETTYHSEAMLTYAEQSPLGGEYLATYQTQRTADGAPVAARWFCTQRETAAQLWRGDYFSYSRYPVPDVTVSTEATKDVFRGVLHLNMEAPNTADYRFAPLTWTVGCSPSYPVTVPFDPGVPEGMRNIRPPVLPDYQAGRTTRIGMWVRGTHSPGAFAKGDRLVTQVIDAERRSDGNPQTLWRAGYGRPVDWTGWRWITIYLNVQPNLGPLEWFNPVMVENWHSSDLDVTHITPLVTSETVPSLPSDTEPELVTPITP